MKILKQLRFTSIIFSLLALAACEAEDPDTKALRQYLSETHHLPLEEDAVYCFIPANQCMNCFRYGSNGIADAKNEKLILISGFPKSNFPGFRYVYEDPDNALLGLRFLDYGNKFIAVRQHKVQGIVTVTDFYRQLDSLIPAASPQVP